jgi:hypothetical protein
MDANTQNINISVEIRVAANKWPLITWRGVAENSGKLLAATLVATNNQLLDY